MKQVHVLFLLCFPLLWGCSKDHETPLEELEKRDTYRFYEVQYHIDLSNGDGTVEKSREIRAESVVNNTSVAVVDTVQTPNDQFEYTEFKADSIPNYLLEIGEDAVIEIPEKVASGSRGSFWYRAEKQLFVTDGSYSFPHTPSVKVTSSGSIPPYCKQTVSYAVRYNETTVSYTALFIGKETGKMLEITGKCISTDIIGYDTTTVLSEIE